MIPKKIHLAWVNTDLLNSNSPLVTEGVKKLIELNPEWEVTIHTDDDVDAYLKEKLDESLYALIGDKHPVQKTDLWRLIKIYAEGGVYMDIDRFCDTPLDDLIDEEKTKWVLPICRDYDFSQDFIMSVPLNPAIETAINLFIDRLLQGHTNIYLLGAQTYMHALTASIMGEMIDTNPGKEVFQKIKDKLNELDFVTVFDEDPPYHTVIYRGGENGLDWEQEKRKLYKEFGLKHWTNEW